MLKDYADPMRRNPVDLTYWPLMGKARWRVYTGENMARKLRILLPLLNGITLDAGCGPGYYALQMAHYVPVVGVDKSPKAIQTATQGRDRNVPPLPLAFEQGDLLDLRFDDKEFDTTVCCAVIEHLDSADHKRLVRELARVTYRRLILTTPAPGVMVPGQFPGHRSNLSGQELVELGVLVGNHVEHIMPYGKRSQAIVVEKLKGGQ